MPFKTSKNKFFPWNIWIQHLSSLFVNGISTEKLSRILKIQFDPYTCYTVAAIYIGCDIQEININNIISHNFSTLITRKTINISIYTFGIFFPYIIAACNLLAPMNPKVIWINEYKIIVTGPVTWQKKAHCVELGE